MDETQNPVVDPYDLDLSAEFADDPAMTKPKPRPRNSGAPVSTLWDQLWSAPGNTARAVGRGALQAANEASNTAVGAVLGISKATGAYKVGRTPEQRKAWLESYNKPTETQNPFQFSEETIESLTGAKQHGLYGVVEGVAQFATGMVATGGAFKALGIAQKAAGAGKAAKFATEAVKGGVVDAAFFAANEQRLSDAVAGTVLENPVSRLLASEADDTVLEGKLKNVAEGLVLGSTLELVIGGVKAARAAKRGDTKAAAEILEAAEIKASTPAPTDVATVRLTDDGKFAVAPIKAADDVSMDTPKFDTRAEAETQAAALNMVSRNLQEGHDPDWLNTLDVTAWKRVKDVFDADGDPRDAAEILEELGYNPKYVQSPEEQQNVLKALVQTHLEPSTVARGRVETWEETAQKAMDLGLGESPDTAMAQVAKLYGNTDNLAAHMFLARTNMQVMTNQAAKLARAADLAPEDGDLALALTDALGNLLEFHSYLSGATSSVARALNAQKMVVGEAAEGAVKTAAKEVAPEAAEKTAKAAAGPLEGLTKQEIRDLARSVFMSGDDPVKVLKVLRGLEETKKAAEVIPQTTRERVRDFALTWRMEAMLSGPATHVGNILSNAMAMMQRPAEYWWAGVRSKDKALQDFGVDMVRPVEMWHDLRDSMEALGKSLKTGTNVLDPSNPYGISDMVDLNTDTPKPFAGTALKVLFRAPSRLLMASDEFFKQMNYRMNVRAQILRQAREQGITDTAELSRRLRDQSKFAFAPDGSAANAWALDYARVSTFTNSLGEGTIGQSIQNMANEHPSVRLILPFINTPVNIFRYAAERTPVVARFMAENRAALKSGDPQRIALAQAKAEMGTLFWSVGGLLAYNKVITGGGPADPELRRQLREAGWQPYSVRVGDRYVSFRRGDPVFTAFSIVADLVEMSSEMPEAEFTDAASLIMASVAASVTSKSFMQGFSDFFEAVSSGRPYNAERFFANLAGSFVPNVLRKVDPNPHIMETRTFVEELKARVPGFSTDLEPRRNLFGEPVVRPPGLLGGVDNIFNPFTISGKVEKPNVLNELVKLGKAMPMPQETLKNNTVNLKDRDLFDDRTRPDGQKQSPYDRWLELIGQTSLRANLTELVQSEDYKAMPDEIRLSAATAMVKAAQDQAFAQMIQEYPSLQEALQMADEMRGAQYEGGDAVKAVMERHSKLFVKPKQRPNAAMPD